MRIDRAERRIGLSIKAAKMPADEFMRQRDDLVEGLRRGEDMVDLAGAFDEALGGAGDGEEWRPGQDDKQKDREKEKRRNAQVDEDEE